MPLPSDENRNLRARLWQVFRSASRDHLTPFASAGRQLQRLRIQEALPVSGTYEGIAQSVEDREAARKERDLQKALAERNAVGTPLGITQYLFARLATIRLVESAAANERWLCPIGEAPFDGFVREITVDDTSATPMFAIAVRTSGGATMFRTVQNDTPGAGFLSRQPDHFEDTPYGSSGKSTVLQNVRMPVFAGEEIFASIIIAAGTPVGTYCGNIILGLEAFIMARPGSAASESMFGALTVESRRAARVAEETAGRLNLEREKTERERLEQEGLTKRAELAVELQKAKSRPISNPFFGGIGLPRFEEKVEARKTPPVPPTFPYRTDTPPAGGEDKTFVSSWMPNANAIGYLIPDPPVGGKVNVFGDEYTVWDVTGKQVSRGKIELVKTQDDIPAQARISRARGVAASPGLTAEQVGIRRSRAGAPQFPEEG